jgi:hypothetical protein
MKQVTHLGRHFGSLRVGGLLPGTGNDSFKELCRTVWPREPESLQDLLGDRAPRIGFDRARQPTPVRDGSTLDGSEHTLERPYINRIVG